MIYEFSSFLEIGWLDRTLPPHTVRGFVVS
jgi:hypothetical protein